MALMEWKEDYRIGIAAVDHEHQELIALLNDLYDSLEGTVEAGAVADFLGEVFAQISAHFALEERVMAERGYDQFGEHKAQHELLLEEIRDIMDQQETSHPDGVWSGEELRVDLGGRLERWFGEHFRTHDARLHKKLGVIHGAEGHS